MSMPATPRRPVEKIEVSPRLRYALDRHRSRAAWFRKAGKPAVDIARQFVATRRLPTLPCPVRSESLPEAPIRPSVI